MIQQDKNSSNATELDIIKLTKTILKLMPRYPNGWVAWRKVSKEQFGSEEFDVLVSCLARLDDWSHLFDSNDKVVKLSESGISFAKAPRQIINSAIDDIADCVRKYAAGLDRIYLKVHGISRVSHVGKKFIQAVYVEMADDIISSECPVEFRPNGGGTVRGKIVGQEPEGGVFYVSFDSEILESSLPGILSIDRAFLLHQLSEGISSLKGMPYLINKAFSRDNSLLKPIENLDSLVVADKLAQLVTPWTRFLWGPPGAGKTYALGHLILRLSEIEPDGKVLLVAPSNKAVDVAIEQLLCQLKNTPYQHLLEDRKILRYGYPRSKLILERSELLGPSQLDKLSQEIKSLSTQVNEAEIDKGSNIDLAVFRAKILALQEEMKNTVIQHMQQCQIVASTVTLAYMSSSPFLNCEWDTVIVDEVTMVTPAICVFLASLAKSRLLLAGDPRQLGPVYENNRFSTRDDFEWMGRDVFDKSGVSNGEGQNRLISTTDNRLARITSQRRCGSDIWSSVESLYPEVDNLSEEEYLQALINLPPSPGNSVVILDTSSCEGYKECRKFSRSWQNPYNADLAIEVASTIAAETTNDLSIAIITPYRAQVNLVKKLIRQEHKADRTPFDKIKLETGTVHQFQGSDADVVIFDMVDGEGRNQLGTLLKGDTGIRLINVAITRAKGKLVIIADKNWCKKTFGRFDNPILWDLIMERRLPGYLRVIPPKKLLLQNSTVKTESPIENMLLDAMHKQSCLSDVIPQFVIYDKESNPISRADFAFPEKKYAVYCDGKQWHLKPDSWQRDWRQRNKLTELGWAFSVFTGSDIYKFPIECAKQVAETYLARKVT